MRPYMKRFAILASAISIALISATVAQARGLNLDVDSPADYHKSCSSSSDEIDYDKCVPHNSSEKKEHVLLDPNDVIRHIGPTKNCNIHDKSMNCNLDDDDGSSVYVGKTKVSHSYGAGLTIPVGNLS